MARIIYALSGEGRGHATRVLAVSGALRDRGHEVRFCCGGIAETILRSCNETVIPVPALLHVVSENRLQVFSTLRHNLPSILKSPPFIANLANQFEAWQPDLLLNDFEAYSWRAADRIGLPVVSLNHQEIVSESDYPLDYSERFDAFVARWGIDRIPPQNPAHRIISSFFFPPLKSPETTTLVGPIIRPEVQRLKPVRGEHVLVYFNQNRGMESVIEAMKSLPSKFIIYGFQDANESNTGHSAHSSGNLTFRSPSIDGFLHDLASSRGVISTAGFSLICESLYLRKPLLVVPNQGQFEQWLNARFLENQKMGSAVFGRLPNRRDIATFLDSMDDSVPNADGLPTLGNAEAVSCIERVLANAQLEKPEFASVAIG